MQPSSTTSAAMLGLLRLRPWTTYELAKQMQRSLRWFWPRAERKLYQEPKLLTASGAATATMEATGNRPRTVYAITEDGRKVLGDWLDRPAEPRTTDFAAMVKVFFADGGTLEQLRATLSEIETEARDRLATLATLTRETLESAPFPERAHLSAITLRYQVDEELAVLAWTAWAREQVDGWVSSTDPGSWDARDQLAEVLASAEAGRTA
ncbi:PadR family transcriptional regulator [Phycicoccus sp. KQZ13P-1]|uniref:PadR family transcriptional regulator n=1 Tax=Phycicoccus mangrovi TaxID=2840470 RepID=UPI001C000B6B|nr:PadR family transcriptional regulator [Phycicoccus mangrovi]MBT9256450.1 PadR family transcriptional regulator [Phycicoccus mangrovi]